MAFYTFHEGDLVATSTRLESAVAAAMIHGPVAVVMDDQDTLLHMFKDMDEMGFSRERLERLTRQAAGTQDRHKRHREGKVVVDAPGVIPIRKYLYARRKR